MHGLAMGPIYSCPKTVLGPDSFMLKNPTPVTKFWFCAREGGHDPKIGVNTVPTGPVETVTQDLKMIMSRSLPPALFVRLWTPRLEAGSGPGGTQRSQPKILMYIPGCAEASSIEIQTIVKFSESNLGNRAKDPVLPIPPCPLLGAVPGPGVSRAGSSGVTAGRRCGCGRVPEVFPDPLPPLPSFRVFTPGSLGRPPTLRCVVLSCRLALLWRRQAGAACSFWRTHPVLSCITATKRTGTPAKLSEQPFEPKPYCSLALALVGQLGLSDLPRLTQLLESNIENLFYGYGVTSRQ
ncbi:uncharacterized protein LOC114029697 [Vombatus ursinus]|uniref:uncharacterized protein LOC114029697 n=1 Tax=Vombatus ursinus TaxID=29139 RepID=UPI000FFD48DC|nr:uncharacterized protein LOC114029697 [Vombatus ursinus]